MVLQLKVGDPVTVTAKSFFDDICPKILNAQKEPCAKLGGTYGIQLFGDGGGAWTLDYGTAKVVSGVADKVDFYVEMAAEDFQGMMKGTLNLDAAARGGRIRFEGDPSLFNNLAAILKPAD